MSSPEDLTELRTWQRIRRYAVPDWMIEECAQRAGDDWRGRCAAGRIDVGFDLGEVADRFGSDTAERIELDLSRLAPDLLRWHLPRALDGRSSLVTDEHWILSCVDDPVEKPLPKDTPLLAVRLPSTVDGSQRLRLELLTPADINRYSVFDLPPYLWSTEHVRMLRFAYGGSAERLPGFQPDGTPIPVAGFADDFDPTDPASRAEAALRQLSDGEFRAAWRTAGIDLDLTPPESTYVNREGLAPLLRFPFNLTQLVPEANRLATRYGRSVTVIRLGFHLAVELTMADPARPRARLTGWTTDELKIGSMVSRRPPDLDLLWQGLITPGELHPLVRQALFPGRPEPAAPGPTRLDERPIRVRCRGDWHTVVHRDGKLDTPSHTVEEAQREQAIRSLGGQVTGCFAVQQAWTGGRQRLPRRLRQERQEILQKVLHGGSRTLLELLDAGLDPHMRDGRGRCLLHHLRAMDHTEVLPRLLAAGLRIDSRDVHGRTPLHVAVGDVGSVELVRALLEAGADPNVEDDTGTSALEIAYYKSGAEYADDEDLEQERSAIARIHDLLNEWVER
ncbi:hypothetical protein GCM10027290_63690 [Micromonospora sonneratiae]|uniref:Ankyrin repeat domain-containing protein n=1 Tax=Micromonospora sonneratiae TaxID=1184706 RepID=A0ABW3YHX4_9ACTN